MKISDRWEKLLSILTFFNNHEIKVFMFKELKSIFQENQKEWNLSCSFEFFIQGLKELKLKELKLKSPSYIKVYYRYSWGKPNKYQLGLSIRTRSYLSHCTAINIHKLSKHKDTYIYVNSEQSVKPIYTYTLEQHRIDNAFKGKSRRSKYVFPYDGVEYLLLNGKNTNNLGVEEKLLTNNKLVKVTNIERTLIDIVVRPIYSGGVENILTAYIKSKKKVSIEILLNTLNKMEYIYPYHQSIGLYLEMAGYNESILSKIQNLGLNYDFYLDHGIKKTSYSKRWKVYYPKDLGK